MKKALFLSASVLAIAAATIVPALSFDAPRGAGGFKDAPVYVPVPIWTGFYFGLNGGYAKPQNDDQFAEGAGFGGFGGIEPKGGFIGGQAGYNWQMPGSPLLIGVEADLQASDIGQKISLFDGTVESRLDWFGTIRGRIGYAANTSLLYFTGGFAFGGVNNRLTPFQNQDNASGYVLGGGYEYKFNPAWSMKVEYQYINLGKHEPTFEGIPLSATDDIFGVKINDDAFHTIRVGISYHVGGCCEQPMK